EDDVPGASATMPARRRRRRAAPRRPGRARERHAGLPCLLDTNPIVPGQAIWQDDLRRGSEVVMKATTRLVLTLAFLSCSSSSPGPSGGDGGGGPGPTSWLTGLRGALVASDDGDLFRDMSSYSPTRSDLLGIFCVNHRLGWAVGEGGTAIATSDGGWNWR